MQEIGGFGEVLCLYGAKTAQKNVLLLTNKAVPGDRIAFFAFTLDRRDIVNALVDAKCRSLRVKVALDAGWVRRHQLAAIAADDAAAAACTAVTMRSL